MRESWRMDDGQPGDDLERLRQNIAEELRAQLGLRSGDLNADDIDDVAAAVAANVDYAFSTEWAPRWHDRRVSPGPRFVIDGHDVTVVPGGADIANYLEPWMADEPIVIYDEAGQRCQLRIDGSVTRHRFRFLDEDARRITGLIPTADDPEPERLRSVVSSYLKAAGVEVPAEPEIQRFSRACVDALNAADRRRRNRFWRSLPGVTANLVIAAALLAITVVNVMERRWGYVALAAIVLLGVGVLPALRAHREGDLYFTRRS